MKLRDLKNILYSTTGNVQFAIVYDPDTHTDLENGCSIDYAVKTYGDKEIERIEAYEHKLVLTIKSPAR